ncbi:MAG: hypothetical protein Q8R30_01785 [bacterium]|nr:hypothetical protein [bacterium]MDZ4285360.1 hypothetical protein [Candidatus Sungbacteria bacterium]
MYLLPAVALIALGAGVYGWYQFRGEMNVFGTYKTGASQNGSVVIELRETGFSPSETTIVPGQTVTFTTIRGKDFWPASDPHPTHEYLNGFDSGDPISSGKSWNYTFLESGTWRFHDHLEPSFHGTIVVADTIAGASSGQYGNSDKGDCDGKCFDTLVRATVKKDGIDAAYKLFTDAYAAGKLPRSCHWTAHQIGEAAYDLFREGKEFPISRATSYCGYGFYHGFLEHLLRERPNTDYALSFCALVEKHLGKQGLWNCYHGIGHGFTEDPPAPALWGKPDAILRLGIGMCERLFGSSFPNLNLCLTGVYTVLAGFAEKGEFGISFDPEDPFAFCRTQPYRYQKACYGEFAPKLDSLPGWSLARLLKILEKIHDDKTQRLVVWVVPSVMMAQDILKNNHDAYITGCREFFGNLKNICLGGVVLGFFTHGQPEKQYIEVSHFCEADLLHDDERNFCYQELFHRMRQEYAPEKVAQACDTMPDQYKASCPQSDYKPAYDDPSFD